MTERYWCGTGIWQQHAADLGAAGYLAAPGRRFRVNWSIQSSPNAIRAAISLCLAKRARMSEEASADARGGASARSGAAREGGRDTARDTMFRSALSAQLDFGE